VQRLLTEDTAERLAAALPAGQVPDAADPRHSSRGYAR
jgi:hypothetical protein